MELGPGHPSLRSAGRNATSWPPSTSLLELVAALCEETDDDREVVCAVIHLLRAGRVQRAPMVPGPVPALGAR